MMLEKYNLIVPIARCTIHSCLKKLGCTYERHSQSYYTDGHERPDVVESRKGYVSKGRKFALRKPLWVRVETASLSPQELERFNDLKETGDGAFYAEVYDCEVGGKACIEFHVDLLKDDGCVETFDRLREALGPEGGHYSVRCCKAAAAPCEEHHPPDKCKCGKKIYHIGQDESVYKEYAREGNEWVIQGVRGLRKKTEGPGEMVSAFQDERRGFGLPLSEEELKRVNLHRQELGRSELDKSPGTRFLVFGKNKGGFWGFDEFQQQTTDVMDVIEPDMQLVIEVDHSAGHAKGREDGLHVTNMNVKYGGKQKVLRDSIMTEGCLGPGEAKMYRADGKWSTTFSEGAKVVDLKLKVGDTQRMTFAPGAPPPPFYDWDALPHNQVVGTTAKNKRKRKSGTGVCDAELQDGREEGATSGAEKPDDRIKEGYAGKPKGTKQTLWERGWWVEGMGTGAKVDPDKNIATVLSKLPDFAGERSALQHTVESRGHILLLSPKCHPEVAGVGIEYSWGMSKSKFRRETNDGVPKHLHANIVKSMCREKILTVGRVRRFARRTRDFCRAYREIATIEGAGGVVPEGKEGIENMRKKHKAHRNILDMEPGFIDRQ